MPVLEIDCPICGEVLELTDEDRAELPVGEVIVCNSCNAELEVVVNTGKDFDVELLGILTTCPACRQEFDVTEDMLATAPTLESDEGMVSVLICPHCRAGVEIEFDTNCG